MLTYADVEKHNKEDDCWIILNGKTFDVTTFIDQHPGGSSLIIDVAGQDATIPFLAAHPESVMKLTLGPKGLADSLRGEVDMSTLPSEARVVAASHGPIPGPGCPWAS